MLDIRISSLLAVTKLGKCSEFVSITLFRGFLSYGRYPVRILLRHLPYDRWAPVVFRFVSVVSFVISCWETIRVSCCAPVTFRSRATVYPVPNRVIYCLVAYYSFSQCESDLGGYCDPCHLSFGNYLTLGVLVLINVLHFVWLSLFFVGVFRYYLWLYMEILRGFSY